MATLSAFCSLLLTAYTTSNGVIGGFHLELSQPAGGLLLRGGNAMIDGVAYAANAASYPMPPPLSPAGAALAPNTFYYCYVSPSFAFGCSTTPPLEDGTPSAPLTVGRFAATSSAVSVGSFLTDNRVALVAFYRNGSDVTLIERQQSPTPVGGLDPVDPGLQMSVITVAVPQSMRQLTPAMSDVVLLNTHSKNTDKVSAYAFSIEQPFLLDDQAELSVRDPGVSSAPALPTEVSAGNPAGEYTLNFGRIATNGLEVLGIQRGYREPIHAFNPNYLLPH